ncbi:MAG: cytochrome c oxidase subunit [Baekduia sp.]|jgi:cytochrome c oxidase subunit 2|nr:cytochrome c oxidase subunit [Baekduia sp.]MDX6703246.1 cytochrome c oxidase subunit [Baekduia sp.]
MGEESTRAEADPLGGRAGRRTIMQMMVVGLIASILGIALGLAINWFPVQGSTQAGKIDTLWDVLIFCSVPVFVLVTTVVLFAAWKFKVQPGQEHLDGPPIHGNTRLEVIWTAVPAIMLVSLVTYAYLVLHDIEKAPASGIERQITVNGQQFTWTFSYNEGGKKFTSARLYVPQGESVKFNVKTVDVLHDFWVPAWRMKIDAVPGLTTHYRITPTKLTGPDGYPVVCAELCGLGHAFMRQTAYVLPKPKFDAWVAKMTKPVAAPAAGGGAAPAVDAKALFTKGETQTGATACGGCHKLADAGTAGGVGPALDTVLKGKDAAFIRESILHPDAQIAKGFGAGIMPGNYAQLLSKPEVDALVKYLEEVAAK